jgi:serine/threonine-protein kinase
MFHLLSGDGIHGGLIDASLLIAAATRQAPALATGAELVDAVVNRALAFGKAQRYPDAATMRGDVQALRKGGAPPYVQAIAEGRIQPGEALPRR